MSKNTIELRDIGGPEGMTKELFRELLAAADTSEELVIRVDSNGGSVFDGFAMFDDLKAWPGKTRAVIQSAAFSIASFIPLACDEIEITPNGYFMIHNPMADTFSGDDEEHKSRADLLGKLKATMIAAYSDRTGLTTADVESAMRAETYYSAEEALTMGLVDRILEAKRPSMAAQAAINKLPHQVFAALRSGETSQSLNDKEQTMSETPQAATVHEIEKAYPKASSEFVLNCVRRSLPLAQVSAEYTEEMAKAMEEMAKENEELRAQISAMEEEAKSNEEEEAKAKAMEEEEQEEEAKAKAKRPGVNPVANVSGAAGSKQTAKDRWSTAIAKLIDAGQPRAKAVQIANRQNPGLREAMLAEVNN